MRVGVERLNELNLVLKEYSEDKSNLQWDIWLIVNSNVCESFEIEAEKLGLTKDEFIECVELNEHIIGRLLTQPFNIEKTFDRLNKEETWNYFFVYVDIHGTVLKPDYGNIAKKYYPLAKETLKILSDRKDVKLVLYTCSHTHEIAQYLDFFSDDGIEFDGVNKIDMEDSDNGGNFKDKPYFNVLFEDKAGFIGERDWAVVNHMFKKFGK